MRQPVSLYAGDSPEPHGATPRPVPGVGSRTRARAVGTFQKGVRQAGGDRRNDLARRAGLWAAPFALCGRGEDPLATRRDGRGDQRQPHQQLADGQAPRADQDFGLCQTDGTAEPELTNSPTVSNSIMTPISLL